MGTPWVVARLRAIRDVRRNRYRRARYVVMCWPAGVNRFVELCATDSKRNALCRAEAWYPHSTSRGSFVYDRRSRRVILDTHAAEMARRWAQRLVNYA